MSRWRAAGIHQLISAGIAAGVLALMLGVWYGPTLFQAMGGAGLALIVLGVDVVLGPALTLVVFRSGKRGLKFDLAAIALFQLAALLYGCYVVALARPAFIVFVKDQFQVATVAELDPKHLAEARYPQYRSPPWSGPERRPAEAALCPAARAQRVGGGADRQSHRPAGEDAGRGEVLAHSKRSASTGLSRAALRAG